MVRVWVVEAVDPEARARRLLHLRTVSKAQGDLHAQFKRQGDSLDSKAMNHYIHGTIPGPMSGYHRGKYEKLAKALRLRDEDRRRAYMLHSRTAAIADKFSAQPGSEQRTKADRLVAWLRLLGTDKQAKHRDLIKARVDRAFKRSPPGK